MEITPKEWLEILLEDAQKGDPESQYNVGLAYYIGDGVACNLDTAKKWFTIAAKKGHKEAQERLEEIDSQPTPRPMASAKPQASDGFSWDKFDDDTIRVLAGAMGGHPGDSKCEANAWLASRVPKPTPDFVRQYKNELLKTWLSGYAGLEKIVYWLIDAGVGPMGTPCSRKEYLAYIQKTRNTKTLQTILCDAMLCHPKDLPEHLPAHSVIILKPRESQVDEERKPHSYQKETWDKLDYDFAGSQETKPFQGLVVMPTGSGKTYTTVHWLLEKVITQGYRVLWLAHRHELLNQAAREFVNLARLAVPCGRELRLRIVSGMHCKSSQICPEDDIVVASVSSLARNPDKAKELIAAPKLFLVIDEAHHTPAKSYRRIVEQLRQKRVFHILGITATPTRTIKQERPVLSDLFGGHFINQVEIRELIEKEILARPRIITVKTHADAEKDITLEDREHLQRFHDLSEDWLDRIAKVVDRNSIIVQHYLDRINEYGPTLMFAINVNHAALLTAKLKDEGINAEYVASHFPDGAECDVLKTIQKFKDGEIQVLVNVQMLTEGIDLPAVKAVFLTRPTSSEILFRQMIGRGLRGPNMKGTATAYLVSFEDHWQEFNDWESPFDLVPDITEVAEAVEVLDDQECKEVAPVPVAAVVPWEVIRFVAKRIGELKKTISSPDFFEAIPNGWYVLEDQDDEGEERLTIIPLYDHDLPCWKTLVKEFENLKGNIPEAQQPFSILSEKCFEEFFGDCDYPRPSKYHVGLMVDFLMRGHEKPNHRNYNDRIICDPYTIAREILSHDLRDSEKDKLIKERYSDLAQAIYPHLIDYGEAIDAALREMKHGGEPIRDPKAVPVFSTLPKNPLRVGPAYNLVELMVEVLRSGQGILGKSEPLPHSGEVKWTNRLVKGWYGKAYLDVTNPHGYGLIRINKLLDSPSVDVDTLRFLLWHEYLHLYLKAAHTKEFRRLERLWPDYADADRFLDNLNEVFGVQYW
jgi:superfamily II DNA or RNA helicase